jgi:hypothetical protein
MKHRKESNDIKTGAFILFRDEHGRCPTYCPCGVRCIGGVTLIPGFRAELENLAGDVKGKSTSGHNHEAESSDAPERGGLLRSSDESG